MATQDYQRIAKAIRYLHENSLQQPELADVAEQVKLSPYHFQRLFKRFAGISPKRFLQHITAEHAKRLLRESTSVLDTSFAVGLSSPGRLHDLLIQVEAVTPGEYKSGGQGIKIAYAQHSGPFGAYLLASTARGICRLTFIDDDFSVAVRQLKQAWPHANLEHSAECTSPLAEQIFSPEPSSPSLPLLLNGTNFQLKVWKALLQIPPGAITSYGDLANRLGQPGASRAVGTAIGQNPIGYLIPCHRVLRSNGAPGGYRWGIERKLAILGCEFSAPASSAAR